MLIDYTHSKNTHKLKVVKFEKLKNKKSIANSFRVLYL